MEKIVYTNTAVTATATDVGRDFAGSFGMTFEDAMEWLRDRGLCITKPAAEAIHELDAAMTLLRAVRAYGADKIGPAKLRDLAREALNTAGGANGAGQDYIFADVYEQIVELIEPYVLREGREERVHPFPASVYETVEMMFRHYLRTNPHLAPVVLDGSVEMGANPAATPQSLAHAEMPFEGHSLDEIFDQADMLFTYLAHHISDQSSELRASALNFSVMLRKVQGNVKNNLLAPKIWCERLKAARSLVEKASALGAAEAEWVNQYHRLIRFLGQYKPK